MEKISEGFKGQRAIVTPYSVRKFQSENESTKLLFVTHIGHYPNARCHYRERPEGANENILIYCEAGKGSITIGDEVFALRMNQVFIIPKHTPHCYSADTNDPWSIYWLHFRGIYVPQLNSIVGKVVDLAGSRTDDRIKLFEEIYKNLEMGYYSDNMEYSSCCLLHFLSSIKYVAQFERVNDMEEVDVIQRSILFMKENLSNKLTLEQIASHVGYSSSYFGALFTNKTSFSPKEYYNQLKMQKACSLLQFSTLKIKEIAYNLGYYDPFHFSKAFCQEMEISPKEYRARYQERDQGILIDNKE